jgi:uncharacterized protein YaaW (UPF0174 family)
MKNPVFDKDLTSLLKNCDNNDLDPIVELILGLPSETLTQREAYLEHEGDHKAYVDEIVYEITSFGGNTVANLVRGHGIPYHDMVRDVGGKLGVDETEADTIGTLEEKIILRVLRLGASQMTEEDREALADLLDLESEINDDLESTESTADETAGGSSDEPASEPGEEGDRDYEGSTAATNGQLEAGSEESFPEAEVSRRLADSATSLLGDRIFHVVENVARMTRIRRVLVTAAKVTLVKMATRPLGGGISWLAALGKGIHDLSGPNYTASLSLVCHIGLLRQKYEQIERDMLTEDVEDGSIALL